MRVLVTGARGFVGRWLIAELEGAGHDAVVAPPASRLDIADSVGVATLVEEVRPDLIAHLAAVSFGPDAASDPGAAIRTNVGGTLAIVEAALASRVPLFTVSSSDVYRLSPGDELPLTEGHPLGPRLAYGLTKVGSEGVVLAAVVARGLEAVVVRPFNHTGPGQRPVFAVPAFAHRILEARRSGVHAVRAGNVDVARDVTDVRDVVRAYRLLIESLGTGRLPAGQRVYNVASGETVMMRAIIERLAKLAAWPVAITCDPGLVRADDPPVIRGDASALHAVTGWKPEIPLSRTLEDLVRSLDDAVT